MGQSPGGERPPEGRAGISRRVGGVPAASPPGRAVSAPGLQHCGLDLPAPPFPGETQRQERGQCQGHAADFLWVEKQWL